MFINCFWLLVIDEIYFINKWDKKLKSLYAKVEEVKKRIPCYILLLGVLAIWIKKALLVIFQKAGFLPIFKLI